MHTGENMLNVALAGLSLAILVLSIAVNSHITSVQRARIYFSPTKRGCQTLHCVSTICDCRELVRSCNTEGYIWPTLQEFTRHKASQLYRDLSTPLAEALTKFVQSPKSVQHEVASVSNPVDDFLRRNPEWTSPIDQFVVHLYQTQIEPAVSTFVQTVDKAPLGRDWHRIADVSTTEAVSTAFSQVNIAAKPIIDFTSEYIRENLVSSIPKLEVALPTAPVNSFPVRLPMLPLQPLAVPELPNSEQLHQVAAIAQGFVEQGRKVVVDVPHRLTLGASSFAQHLSVAWLTLLSRSDTVVSAVADSGRELLQGVTQVLPQRVAALVSAVISDIPTLAPTATTSSGDLITQAAASTVHTTDAVGRLWNAVRQWRLIPRDSTIISQLGDSVRTAAETILQLSDTTESGAEYRLGAVQDIAATANAGTVRFGDIFERQWGAAPVVQWIRRLPALYDAAAPQIASWFNRASALSGSLGRFVSTEWAGLVEDTQNYVRDFILTGQDL